MTGQDLRWTMIYTQVLKSEVAKRVAASFMEYEVLQPRDAFEKYFEGRIHSTQLYGVDQQLLLVFLRGQAHSILGLISFLVGLSFSLLFLYQNLRLDSTRMLKLRAEIERQHNKSLEANGGSLFRIMIGPATLE